MKLSQHDFNIYLDARAWAKFQYWTNLAGDNEISALGLVDELKSDGVTTGLLVTEVFLLEQSVNSVETDLEDKAIADLMIQLAREDIDNSRLKCWIHSHAGMKTFWSKTDNDCCAKLANGSYVLSIVTNSQGDIRSRIDVYHPCNMTLDHVPTKIYSPISEDQQELLKAEFEAKVKTTSIVSAKPERFIPTIDFASQEELDEAFEQGLLNMQEYQELAGYAMIDDY